MKYLIFILSVLTVLIFSNCSRSKQKKDWTNFINELALNYPKEFSQYYGSTNNNIYYQAVLTDETSLTANYSNNTGILISTTNDSIMREIAFNLTEHNINYVLNKENDTWFINYRTLYLPQIK